jgi:UDP-2-acetamido-2,6-beta-L-arabino-hexul-4-ose reductase
MLKIGITGQAVCRQTFVQYFGSFPEEFESRFSKRVFDDSEKLNNFVSQCDVIVHLAAMNRHNDPSDLYDTM